MQYHLGCFASKAGEKSGLTLKKLLVICPVFFVSMLLAREPPSASVQRSNHIAVVPPDSRSVEPNSFPTFVFTLRNHSEHEQTVYLEAVLPKNWSCISSLPQLTLGPLASRGAPLTVSIPPDAWAAEPFQVGIVASWDSYVDSASVIVNIKKHPSVRVAALAREATAMPGNTELFSFLISNVGNLKDTLHVQASSSLGWPVTPDREQVTLPPGEKELVGVSVAVPKSAPDGKQTRIAFKVSSLTGRAMGKSVSDSCDMVLKVMAPPKKKEERMYARLPVIAGFMLDKLQKGRRPEASVYLSLGGSFAGGYSTKFDLAQRYAPTGSSGEQELSTRNINFQLGAGSWDLRLGDVLIGMNPLLQRESHTPLSQFPEVGQSGRGVALGISRDRYSLRIFTGKRRFTDYRFTSATAKYLVSPRLNATSSFLQDNDSRILTAGCSWAANDHLYCGTLGGISRPLGNGPQPYGGALQVDSRIKLGSMAFLSRLDWVGKNYTGPNAGRVGGLISSSWSPFLLLPVSVWGRLEMYERSFAGQAADSSIVVEDVLLRALIRPKKWPSIRLSSGFRREKPSGNDRATEEVLGIEVQKHIKHISPLLSAEYSRKRNESTQIKEHRRELGGGLRLSWRNLGTSLQHTYSQVDTEPWGHGTRLETGFRLNSCLLNLSMNRTKDWTLNADGVYSPRVTTDYGIRSILSFHPLSKDMNVQLEVSNRKSQLEGLEAGWQFMLSISTGTHPRFDIPLPMIKTRGRLMGEVFLDQNGNGIRDSGEAGCSQVMLFLADERALVDQHGKFAFSAMESGDYRFYLDTASLPAYLAPSSLMPEAISIETGKEVYLAIPITSVCSIQGKVFEDRNRNEELDNDEQGMRDIRIVVHDGNTQQEWEAFSKPDGSYAVSDLLPGSYTVIMDTLWLPERRVVSGPRENPVALTPDMPQMKLNLGVAEKRLRIIKTFQAPLEKGKNQNG